MPSPHPGALLIHMMIIIIIGNPELWGVDSGVINAEVVMPSPATGPAHSLFAIICNRYYHSWEVVVTNSLLRLSLLITEHCMWKHGIRASEHDRSKKLSITFDFDPSDRVASILDDVACLELDRPTPCQADETVCLCNAAFNFRTGLDDIGYSSMWVLRVRLWSLCMRINTQRCICWDACIRCQCIMKWWCQFSFHEKYVSVLRMPCCYSRDSRGTATMPTCDCGSGSEYSLQISYTFNFVWEQQCISQLCTHREFKWLSW